MTDFEIKTDSANVTADNPAFLEDVSRIAELARQSSDAARSAVLEREKKERLEKEAAARAASSAAEEAEKKRLEKEAAARAASAAAKEAERKRLEKEAAARAASAATKEAERKRLEKEAAARAASSAAEEAERKRLEKEAAARAAGAAPEKKKKKRYRTKIRITVGALIIAVTLIAAGIYAIINSTAQAKKAYALGAEAYDRADYVNAESYFSTAGSYKDADKYETLSKAHLLKAKDKTAAAFLFGSVNSTEALKESRELFWDDNYTYSSVAMGEKYHAVLDKDGTVHYNYTGEASYLDAGDEIATWEDIATISGNNYTVLGVTRGGGIKVAGDNAYSLGKATRKWSNIVAAYVLGDEIIALRADGSIKTTSKSGVLGEARKWKGIRDIDICSFEYVDIYDTHFDYLIVAADADGKAHIACPDFDSLDSEIPAAMEKWEDLVAISVSHYRYLGAHVVGLKSDGTVVAAGTDENGVCNVGEWKDIVDIHTTATYTFGINAYGKVVLVGSDGFTSKKVSGISSAACFADIDNLLVISSNGEFLCEDGRKTFFSELDRAPYVPKYEKIFK